MGEEQPIPELDLGIGIPKEDPMNYGEMADDTSRLGMPHPRAARTAMQR
jgi:hypothetical protein